MIFREKTSFACNTIKTDVRGTSRAVLLADWVDLNTLFVAQAREIARVLGSQGVPAEPDIDPVQASTQGILSHFIDFHRFFRKFPDFEAILRENIFESDFFVTSKSILLDE